MRTFSWDDRSSKTQNEEPVLPSLPDSQAPPKAESKSLSRMHRMFHPVLPTSSPALERGHMVTKNVGDRRPHSINRFKFSSKIWAWRNWSPRGWVGMLQQAEACSWGSAHRLRRPMHDEACRRAGILELDY